jgi:hypothetical protein
VLWRLGASTLRVHVETTGQRLPGGHKQATPKPPAFRLMTKWAAVLVRKVGSQRPRAQPLSTVQQQDRLALGIPATYVTVPPEWRRRRGGQAQAPKAPGRTAADGPDRGGEARVVGEERGLPEASARRLSRSDIPAVTLGRGRETS